ncbi:hypothetical protein B0A50_08059 [Salinomyces thailandicus]|uniref:Uncharacterized protein n=1 Tax=Salinomyces thailandicus TaxID=706561 RepID=A0A4V5N3C3_9PEZI|nr:hypothetical protein B0A50_08059 [Salinomyces thailandica]
MPSLPPPPPSAYDLLPTLLASLPTAPVAPNPPPALLPLLAPVLRQKLTYLTAPSSTTGWLHLLAWDKERAAKLPATIKRIQIEPHPVSGEIEVDFEEVGTPAYRRVDQETLLARFEVQEFGLLVVVVWCQGDEGGDGWRVAEVRCLEDLEDGGVWVGSVSEAEEQAGKTNGLSGVNGLAVPTVDLGVQEMEDDNDDYWNAYDRTPNETPAPEQPAVNAGQASSRGRSQSEAEYFSRYGSVQPAMDSHDPDEEHPDITQNSTLTGDALVRAQAQHHHHHSTSTASKPYDSPQQHLEMPRPLSPTSSSSNNSKRHSSIDKLEQEAAAMSSTLINGNANGDAAAASSEEAQGLAQRAVRLHVSSEMKSLFRLAKGVGMGLEGFRECIDRELEVLCLLDEE